MDPEGLPKDMMPTLIWGSYFFQSLNNDPWSEDNSEFPRNSSTSKKNPKKSNQWVLKVLSLRWNQIVYQESSPGGLPRKESHYGRKLNKSDKSPLQPPAVHATIYELIQKEFLRIKKEP